MENKCLYCGDTVFINVELFAGEMTPMCKNHYDEYKEKEKIEQGIEAEMVLMNRKYLKNLVNINCN